MTEDELKAKIEELEQAVEALSSKNREILSEKKALQSKLRGSDTIDSAEYEKVLAERDELKANYAKLERTTKQELEKLTKTASEKDSALQRYLIDDGLTTNLAKAGVAPQFIDAAKALLRQQVQIKAEDGNYSAVIGDKALTEAITDWASSDNGKFFVAAPKNSGGGATGSNGTTVKVNPFAKDTLNLTEQLRLKRENPEMAERLKSQAQS